MSIESGRLAWLTSARDQAAVELIADIIKADIRPALVICVPTNAASETGHVESIQRLCGQADIEYLEVLPDRVNPIGDSRSVGRLSALEEAQRKIEAETQRRAHDERLAQLIHQRNCQIVVLAGYMKIVTSALRTQTSILNLHPAPPLGPVGTWQEVTWTLMAIRARLTGAMLHIATEKLDRGPVISYYTIPLDDDGFQILWSNFADKLRTKSLQEISSEEGEREPLFGAIRERQFAREAPLLVVTLRHFINRDLEILHSSPGGVRFRGALYPNGGFLNDEVEAFLQRDADRP